MFMIVPNSKNNNGIDSTGIARYQSTC
jgi:hypothetical protein